MQQLIDPLLAKNQDWQQLCKKLESTISLSAVVLTAWQMGLLIAKAIVEQHLAERAQLPIQWKDCSVCGTHLHSKGFVRRQMLTLIVTAALPGERWEIEFFSSGSVEVEKFVSNGEIAQEEALREVSDRHSETAIESHDNELGENTASLTR